MSPLYLNPLHLQKKMYVVSLNVSLARKFAMTLREKEMKLVCPCIFV
jgi:hypothetical protein